MAKRYIAVLLGLIVGAGLLVWSPHVPVPNEAQGRSVTRWDETIALDEQGGLNVFIDFTYDFGRNPGHGPTVMVVDREKVGKNLDRIYRVGNVRANVPHHEVAENGLVTIYLGDPDVGNVSGVHDYQLYYHVTSPLDASTGTLHWNVMGTDSTVPISNASLAVLTTTNGQAGDAWIGGAYDRESLADVFGSPKVAAASAECWAGAAGSASRCTDASISQGSAVFRQERLAPGDPWTVKVTYPANSFDVTPITAKHKSNTWSGWRDPTVPGCMTGAGWALITLSLLSLGWMILRPPSRRYRDLPPGLTPAPGDVVAAAATTIAWRRVPVAVRFDPPTLLKPREVHAVEGYGRVSATDLGIALIDLAARGFARLSYEEGRDPSVMVIADRRSGAGREPVDRAEPEGSRYRSDRSRKEDLPTPHNWKIARTLRPGAESDPVDRLVLDAAFGKKNAGSAKSLSALGKRPEKWRRALTELEKSVQDAGWFRTSPKHGGWRAASAAVVTVGAILTLFGFGSAGVFILGGGVLGGGIVMLLCGPGRRSYTAGGTAAADQVRSFRLFMETADADMLRRADTEDPGALFTRYLPWAMAFGLTERWTKLCSELAATDTASGTLSSDQFAAADITAATSVLMSSMNSAASNFTSTSSSDSSGSSSSTSYSSSSYSSSSSGGGSGGGGVGGW